MIANVISSPTFRYLQGNKADVEFENVSPKPYSNVDDDSIIEELNNSFSNIKFGVNEELVNLNKEKSNSRYVIKVDSDIQLKTIKYELSKKNDVLLDDIKIQAEPNTKSNFLIDYENIDDKKSLRNSVLYVYAKENSTVNIYLVSRQNDISKIFQSVAVITKENSRVNLYQVELGMGNKIFSCHGNLIGDNSTFNIDGAYFLEKNQTFDILYNNDIYAKHSDTNITINGIQKDNSKKVFKGTLDFKRGSSASKGTEEEYVTLLDKTVRSKSLPIILCSEENITGNHAASAGQLDEDMLFYIMSRGFSRSEATSLIVEAKLIPVIDKLPDENLKKSLFENLRAKMTRK